MLNRLLSRGAMALAMMSLGISTAVAQTFTYTTIAADASIVWRDYNTSGVPSSGIYNPKKSDLRQWGSAVGGAISQLQIVAGLGTGSLNLSSGSSYRINGTSVLSLSGGGLPLFTGLHQSTSGGASGISAAPASNGSWNSITTAFSGDLSKVPFATAYSITGAATLTQPASGYYYQNEAFPHLTYLYNSSGWNQSTSTNDGRTAATAYRTKVDNYGQGDAVAYNCTGFVTGTRAGSTDFLANPAVSCHNGDLTAGAAGVYLNPGEFALNDNGFDAAGIGWVVNLNRTVATGAKNAFWAGFRAQSIGSADVDAAFSAIGHFKVGLDLTGVSLPPSGTFANAAIILDQGMRIYANGGYGAGGKYTATSAGLDWIERSASGFWNFIFNNTSALQISDTQVTSVVPFYANAGVKLSKVAVASLPTCNAGAEGTLYAVTDANSSTFNSAVAGGGSNHVMAFCNGTGWTVH